MVLKHLVYYLLDIAIMIKLWLTYHKVKYFVQV